MRKKLTILYIEDSKTDVDLVYSRFLSEGFSCQITRVDTQEAFKEQLTKGPYDLILADYYLPLFDGLSALFITKEANVKIPFIFVTGILSEEKLVESLKNGATDYVSKNRLDRLAPVVERALKEVDDAKKRTEAEAMVKRMAYYDTTTSLPNRNSLETRIDEVVVASMRAGEKMSLLLINIERFREVNQALGYNLGDQLLMQVGKRLAVFSQDMLSRVGGDEFSLVLPKTAEDGATQVAEKILAGMEEPFQIGQIPISLDVNIGISCFPDHGTTAKSLIQQAEVAMYLSRETHDGYQVYSFDQDRHSPFRIGLMGEMRSAIDRGEMFLAYQPKVRLQTKTVVGVEGLIRWRHREHGILSPNQFIPVSERTGLVRHIAQWSLSTALRQCRAWYQADLKVPVAVNFSARNLFDKSLIVYIHDLIARAGIPPSLLEIEITESHMIENLPRSLNFLKELKQSGVRLCLDDFGTGYAQMGYMKELPVDDVKIDRSFIIAMKENAKDRIIVRSIIDLAHALGHQVIAEGVEDPVILERLTEMGCDVAQGHYICAPLPLEEVNPWLMTSPWKLEGVTTRNGL